MTRASETSMSNEQKRDTAFKTVRSRQLRPSRNYARVPGYKKKYKKNTRIRREKEKKNGRRRNQYARVRRYKITSTLGLLVRGDPQNEGLRGLQPRRRLEVSWITSTRDYFYRCYTGASGQN